MKACPGPRSGIDRSGSLSFAIRGIPSSIRPPIRHSRDRKHAPYPDTGAGIHAPMPHRKTSIEKPATSTTVNVARSKTTRGEGLVPAGVGVGRGIIRSANSLYQNHNSRSSYLGVPPLAGMSDCYESMSRTPIRDVPSNQP